MTTFTTQQVAALLGKAPNTITAQAQALGIEKHGRKWAFTVAHIEQLRAFNPHRSGRKPDPKAKYHNWRKRYPLRPRARSGLPATG